MKFSIWSELEKNSQCGKWISPNSEISLRNYQHWEKGNIKRKDFWPDGRSNKMQKLIAINQ